MARLWKPAQGSGSITLPPATADDGGVFFLPQRPFVTHHSKHGMCACMLQSHVTCFGLLQVHDQRVAEG